MPEVQNSFRIALGHGRGWATSFVWNDYALLITTSSFIYLPIFFLTSVSQRTSYPPCSIKAPRLSFIGDRLAWICRSDKYRYVGYAKDETSPVIWVLLNHRHRETIALIKLLIFPYFWYYNQDLRHQEYQYRLTFLESYQIEDCHRALRTQRSGFRFVRIQVSWILGMLRIPKVKNISLNFDVGYKVTWELRLGGDLEHVHTCIIRTTRGVYASSVNSDHCWRPELQDGKAKGAS